MTSLADRAPIGHAGLCPRHGLIHGTARPADIGGDCNWRAWEPTLRGALIAAAALLLAALATAEGVVSWHGQYSFLIAIKHQELSAALEALGPDCGAVIFAILGVALALLGKRAVTERVLVCACSGLSIAMNLAASDLGSPRAIGAYALPPVLFAVTSDRLIATIRLAAIGKDETRSAWRTIGRAPLWALRVIFAPRTTISGARRALLAATPLPAPEPEPVVTWQRLPGLPKPAPVLTLVPEPPAAPQPTQVRAARKPRAIAAGPTKTAQLIEKAAGLHDLAAIDPRKVSALATRLAPEVGMNAAAARRALLHHVRTIQGIQP